MSGTIPTMLSMIQEIKAANDPEKRLQLREVFETYVKDTEHRGVLLDPEVVDAARDAMHESSPEYCLRQATVVLRRRLRPTPNYTAVCVTEQAVLPGIDENEDGYADANPDKGAGTEAGHMVLTIEHTSITEDGTIRGTSEIFKLTEIGLAQLDLVGDADRVAEYVMQELFGIEE